LKDNINPKRPWLIRRGIRVWKRRGLKYFLHTIPIYLIEKYVDNTKKSPIAEKFVIKDILGSKMYLDATDFGLSHDLIRDGIREAYQVEVVNEEVKPGDVVIDVGANIGYYALLESRLTGKNGKIYAIEPVPANVEILRINRELNQYDNIEVFQLAISDKKGHTTMYVPRERNLSRIKASMGGNQSNTIEVETATLDDFLQGKRYPQVIRMDVEGAEYQIVKGMEKTLTGNLPLEIFMEIHFDILTKNESINLLEALKNTGFEIKDATFEGWMKGFGNYKTLGKIACFFRRRRCPNAPPFGHVKLTINDIIANKAIINGDWGALEICFKRSGETK